MNDVSSSSSATVGRTAVSRRARWLRLFGLGMIFMALLVLFYGGVAYLGWQSGERIRQEEMVAAQESALAHQLELAVADVAAGRHELALRRLDWIEARQGGYAGVATVRAEAIAQTVVMATATATVVPTVTPLPTATVVVEGEEVRDTAVAAEELAELTEMVETGKWAEAIEAIPDFQAAFPSYERQVTNQLLYDSYVRHGQNLLETEQIELGLSYLEQARGLGDLSEPVEGQVTFAELYLEGIVFYEVNWPAYLYYFRELCTFAPLFHNSCSLLFEGLVAYGDQLAVAQDWCPAVAHYREARNTLPAEVDEVLVGKIEQARDACALATPTPAAVITGTLPITPTEGGGFPLP